MTKLSQITNEPRRWSPWVVLDIETTGLIPTEDLILECAAILVDTDLNELAVFEYVSGYNLGTYPMSAFVRDMHTRNGLLAEVSQAYKEGRHGWQLDEKLRDWADSLAINSIQLIGNSIHFDRSFLAEDCRTFTELLHHRMIDVSSLNVLDAVWAPNRPPRPKAEAHRALTDCRESLATLRVHRASLWP